MDEKRIHDKRLRALLQGKLRKVSLWERLTLQAAGIADGIRELPRADAQGHWSSPFLGREISGYEEFCSSMWSLLQVENEASFARLKELSLSIPALRARMAQAKIDLTGPEQEEIFFTRKRGEEALTEDQVRARRQRERDRQLAPLRSSLSALEQEALAQTEEFTRLCSRLEENANTIRLAIQRVQNHTRQRMAIYWSAVLRHHPEGDRMPVLPNDALSLRAEEAYTQLHNNLMAAARALGLPETEAA